MPQLSFLAPLSVRHTSGPGTAEVAERDEDEDGQSKQLVDVISGDARGLMDAVAVSLLVVSFALWSASAKVDVKIPPLTNTHPKD